MTCSSTPFIMQCPQCNAEFSSESSLRGHMRRKHRTNRISLPLLTVPPLQSSPSSSIIPTNESSNEPSFSVSVENESSSPLSSERPRSMSPTVDVQSTTPPSPVSRASLSPTPPSPAPRASLSPTPPSPAPRASLSPSPPPAEFSIRPPRCLTCEMNFRRPSGMYQHMRYIHHLPVRPTIGRPFLGGPAVTARRYVQRRNERFARHVQQQEERRQRREAQRRQHLEEEQQDEQRE
ncbi:uncharacterized protein BYT42DRAFT_590880 [Radiomyces spectabilis]|uniref:uncharacterized protein n=1 Tax=Radiomyces spectabilis TaxID=64574 RepID=UPI002220D508|nr:uncharacterized protein BYT42DRAFT_590880 [Radiomyces spectabilis]KAI8364140.1 hypothetical protein BYT42DRAFT_590880 [Radiomyces spectabilis]